MGKEIDPSDIGKYPEIIKKAQSEIGTMDVLVCGNCNNVFHFVEQFREHKGTRCTKSVQQKDNLETRPVIWSFLLWKAAQLNHDQNKDPNHSHGWRLYQTWMKLDEAIKETWVVAGRTIQSFAKVGQGSLQEMPVKITKTVVGNQPEQSRGRQLINNRLVAKPPPPSAKELNDSFNALKDSDKRPMVRTIPAKPTINNRTVNPVGILARKALRTVGTNASGNAQAIEHNIEKILAKRFNPRQREHEYLIKWENLGHERNTWEPASHLEKVPVILDTFEKQLALQKEKRLAVAKQAQQQQQMANAKTSSKDDSSQSEDDTGASSVKRRRVDTSIGVASGGVAGVTMRKVVRNEPTHLVQQVKTNGLPAAPVQTKKGNDKSADVVITDAKDGKPTGIVKKSGVTPNTRSKNEAQIKFIPKGGDSVSGVVRVANAATPTTSPANRVMQKMGSTTVKPVQGVQRSTVTKAKLAEMERAASVQHLAVANEVKPTITRVVKSAPNSKNVTPEQKIAALTRQGNLKITRKTVCGQTSQAQPILIQDAGDDFSISDSFGMNVVAATATTPTPKVEGSQTQIHIDQHDQDLLGQVLGHVTNDGNIALQQHEQQQLLDASQLQQQGIVTDQNGIQQILASNDDGTQQLIQFVTGEDGTIYQVAGKNEQGQTILIAQGADGEQQCVYVAADDQDLLGGGSGDEANNGNTIDGNLVDASNADVQQQLQQQLINADGQTAIHYAVDGDENVQGLNQQLQVATEDGDSQDGQITAEVVQADLPSPGGTRRVVLQLPDGTFMVTEVDEEQFKALNMQT